ncbi:hypothetical protein C8J56DRAFT_1058749 [Mycena floridula]|nr:hypothetical protein C8J56DRAFT_1058749 [Mycena floridula]
MSVFKCAVGPISMEALVSVLSKDFLNLRVLTLGDSMRPYVTGKPPGEIPKSIGFSRGPFKELDVSTHWIAWRILQTSSIALIVVSYTHDEDNLENSDSEDDASWTFEASYRSQRCYPEDGD